VVSSVKKYAKKPLIVKLTPNVTDITEIAKAAEDAGADSVSLINTILGMAIDAKTRRPILGNITGGLSGPAVKPIALRMVYQVSKAVKIPVIGMGGISNGTDAIEFLLAGASAVMIGTAGFVNPMAWVETIEGIEAYMALNHVNAVTELIGGLIV
jgi:dihydroorotate dehydrogenase (NAD+) catalytic subunit